MMEALRRALGAPARWWAKSLLFRVVASCLLASGLVLMLVGGYVINRTAQGMLEVRTTASIAEASAIVDSMQRELASSDAATASISDRLASLVREQSDRGGVGDRYFVVVTGPSADLTGKGIDAASVPAELRQSAGRGEAGPMPAMLTTIRYTDGRASRSGLAIAGTLGTDASGHFPIYFLFSLNEEQAMLKVAQGEAFTGALIFLPAMTLLMYLISLQILRPVRAARLATEGLAAGELERRMDVSGPDESAALARSINFMAGELQNKVTELENLSRVQQQFVSDVSHELRTPLTTVRMAADVIYAAREEFSPVASRSAELLSREVDRFEVLLTDLLEMSRFDAGAAHLVLEDLDVVELVADEVESQRPLALTFGSTLTLHAPSSCFAQVDARRVRRIVTNLVSNAIEHGEGLPIEVYVASNQEAIAIVVRDHGVGLSQDEATQVFTRFWRADPSRFRTAGGTGLGLSIALENAELHGGQLDVWGRPHEGAQFRLTLPKVAGRPFEVSPWPSAPPETQMPSD